MYQVISEFVDSSTGRRVQPGEDFTPDAEQAARLILAGCLVHVGGVARASEPAPAASPEPVPFFSVAPADKKPPKPRSSGAGKRPKRR